MKYEITLPDGSKHTRNSSRTCTHAIVAQRAERWVLVSFCETLELAKQLTAALQSDEASTEPTQIVPVRIIIPLTDHQREFLNEIGDRAVELMMGGTSDLVALVRRGLLERCYIGMRWWRVRRTAAGRRAVEAAP